MCKSNCQKFYKIRIFWDFLIFIGGTGIILTTQIREKIKQRRSRTDTDKVLKNLDIEESKIGSEKLGEIPDVG